MSRELQTLNQQNKLALWAERISACRDSGQAGQILVPGAQYLRGHFLQMAEKAV